MKVRCGFTGGAIPAERAAIEAGDFPFHVHGVRVDRLSREQYGWEIEITGAAEVVLDLLRRAGYEEDHYEVVEP